MHVWGQRLVVRCRVHMGGVQLTMFQRSRPVRPDDSWNQCQCRDGEAQPPHGGTGAAHTAIGHVRAVREDGLSSTWPIEFSLCCLR